jgi:glyoxylase-like metal-dependent hydrolase (beta-lactamase superfamily II)
MADWFHVSTLADGVWQLTEPGHVCSWLVEGDDRAALIDTGCGFAPIRPVVEALTERPVVVVQTHHHLDHVGGSHEFDDILIHGLGVDGLAGGVPDEVLEGYLRYAAELESAFELYAMLDQRFFHLVEDAHRVRRRPPSDAPWRIVPVVATGTIEDGEVVDLGGRGLRVLHTPGHSADCVSLELVGERLLFGGDTVNTGPVYTQMPDSDVAVLRASLARLAGEAERWDRVFCSHFLRTEVPPGYLARQVAALDVMLAGEAPLRPALDCVGRPVLEAVFDGFSFLVPQGWTAPARAAT